MDRKELIKLLAGTITRGIMWAAAALSSWLGIEALDQQAGNALGFFVAAAVCAGVSAWWSSRKDRKLLHATPPAPNR